MNGRVAMKMTQTMRLILGTAVLTAAVAILWWIVGYALGKSALEQTSGAGAFTRQFSAREASLLSFFALALLSHLTRLLGSESGAGAGAGAGAGRWTRLALLAAAAGLVFGDGGSSLNLGWVLFVFAAAATAEASGVQGLLVALVTGAFVALAFVLDKTEFGIGQKLIVLLARDIFLVAPLLAGPEWLDRWLWRAAK